MAVPTTITKVVTIEPGETIVLPAGADVISISGTLESECADLPEMEELECYYMLWTQSVDDTLELYAWEAGASSSGMITGFNINTEFKILGIPFTPTGLHMLTLRNAVANMRTYPALQNVQFRWVQTSNLVQWYMVFKTFPNVAKTVFAQFAGSGTGAVKTIPVKDSECLTYLIGSEVPGA